MLNYRVDYLFRYSRAVRPPPQDSERNKEGRWGDQLP